MKKIIFQTIGLNLIFLLIISCCQRQGDLIERRTLNNEDLARVAYTDEEIISLSHSNGFIFEATLSSERFFSSTQEECEDYFENEILNWHFTSEIPRLDISLKLSKFSNDEDALFSMTSERRFSFVNIDSIFQTIEIEGVSFENVLKYESLDVDYPIRDLYYNSTQGIIKINYSDSTHVQIIP